MLVPPERSSAVLVVISNKSVSICNRSHHGLCGINKLLYKPCALSKENRSRYREVMTKKIAGLVFSSLAVYINRGGRILATIRDWPTTTT